jgi:hypothetical protein
VKLDGSWYSDGVAPETLHFVPAGLPVGLCGKPRGKFRWPDGTVGNCSECIDACTRIEAEMAREAAQQPASRLAGSLEL